MVELQRVQGKQEDPIPEQEKVKEVNEQLSLPLLQLCATTLGTLAPLAQH